MSVHAHRGARLDRVSVVLALSVGLTLAVTALLLVFAVLFYQSERDQRWQQLHRSLSLSADQLAVAIELPLWNLDERQMLAIMRSTLGNGELVASTLAPGIGKEALVLRRTAAGGFETLSAPPGDAGLLVQRRAVTMGGQAIGSVAVYATPALLHAQLRQRARDDRAAASFYTTALAQAPVSGVPRGMEGMAAAAQAFMSEAQGSFRRHLDAVMAGGLSPAMEEALGLLRGTREIDLQQPSLFYYPGLPQRRFYDPAEFGWMQAVLDLLPAMQAELAAVVAEEAADTFAPYVTATQDRPAPNNPLLGDPAWGAFYFWKDGAAVSGNAARCPATMAALAFAPMPMIPGRAPNALWSRLKPGTHIAPHTGMLNTRLICHVPIRTAPDCTLRVGSETRSVQSGAVRMGTWQIRRV
ncbi:aspartyl/asparaginyl beta-hydroxylase domain-containing protein, partial [Janthinobacterium sp.]|uniref:aspartyl/asparaginyl beta-hydroxylase domain-containing protein n=1 Tax=Janthinobacterium sp. TaxID=1871054 RepID=UPI0025BBB1D1